MSLGIQAATDYLALDDIRLLRPILPGGIGALHCEISHFPWVDGRLYTRCSSSVCLSIRRCQHHASTAPAICAFRRNEKDGPSVMDDWSFSQTPKPYQLTLPWEPPDTTRRFDFWPLEGEIYIAGFKAVRWLSDAVIPVFSPLGRMADAAHYRVTSSFTDLSGVKRSLVLVDCRLDPGH